MEHILIVGDKKSVLSQMLFEKYFVLSADSIQDINHIEQPERVSLVLLEVDEKKADCINFFRQKQESPIWKHVPVIVVLTQKCGLTEEQCFELGAEECLAEPLSTIVVRKRIEHILALKHTENSLEKHMLLQAEEQDRQNKRFLNLQHEVIWGMANLIESRDGTTGGHVKRTRTFVWLIGKELLREGKYPEILTKHYLENLCEAAPMHDIGKIAVPDYILKGTHKLSAQEFEEMKNHAAVGGKMIHDTMGKIEDETYLKIAMDVACYHHEKWDGSGYPKGLKGEEIPLGARIMAVADVLDALAFRRSYKEAVEIGEAIQIIVDSSGSHFDPVVVDAMLAVREEVEERVLAFLADFDKV